MATPHDDPKQQRQPDPRKQEPRKETDLAKEGEQVIDADFEVVGQEAGPLTNPRQSGPATWIAPYQEDAAEAGALKNLAPPPPGGYTNFPSRSLDEPQPPQPTPPRGEILEEAAEVLDDEPVLADPASTASSAIHVAEVGDDVADDDIEVLRDEPRGGTEESSVVDISALVDDHASDVVEDVTPGSSSVLADSAVVVDSPLEPSSAAQESSAILAEPASEIAHDMWVDASEVPTPRPSIENVPVTPPPAASHFDDSPSHAADEVLGGDVEDLDSAVLVDPSSVAQVKTEISHPAPASLDDKEPDINWDEISAAGDSKVARSTEDGDKTQMLAGAKTPRPATPVSHDSDVIADEDVVSQADSGTVELGGQSAAQPPIAGVDPVAEALESGVNIQKPHHAESPTSPQDEHTELDISAIDDGSDSVFDEDILADANQPSAAAEPTQSVDDEAAALFADESGNTPKPAPKTHADAAKDIEFDDDGTKGQVVGEKEAEDLAALAFTDETAEAGAPSAAADDAVDLGAAAVAEEEVAPVIPAKKERKQKGQLVGAGAGKSGRGWLTGMLATLLILVGAAAALWYVKPDLLEQVSKSSPNAVPLKKEKAKVEPPATLARARMDNQQFDQALAILKDAPKTPVNLATRAEARWLKYLQTQAGANKPLDRDAPEVKQVLADLKGADNDLLTMQITKALDASKLSADLAASEKSLANLKAKVQEVQANKVQPNKVQPDKVQGGPPLGAIADALVKAKIWESKDKVDLAALQKALQSLSESRSSLAAVNKLLNEANIGAAADQGVAKLIAAKQEVDGKLALVNKLLTDEKIKGDGVKGLEELIAARDKLAKERSDLHEAIQAAYKELTDANGPPAGTDPRAALEEAVKIARKKSDAAPLAQQRPGFPQPEAGRPNPLLAEQFFDKGLQLFWSQDYPAAESKFRKAVAFYGQDARYQYFLGMSLLAQGDESKRKAGDDAFEKASRLEAANRPSMEEVNVSLERIQGSMRALVNSYRQKALLAAK